MPTLLCLHDCKYVPLSLNIATKGISHSIANCNTVHIVNIQLTILNFIEYQYMEQCLYQQSMMCYSRLIFPTASLCILIRNPQWLRSNNEIPRLISAKKMLQLVKINVLTSWVLKGTFLYTDTIQWYCAAETQQIPAGQTLCIDCNNEVYGTPM